MIDVRPGTTPLVISLPHVGREIPAEVASGMTPAALGILASYLRRESRRKGAKAAG